MDECPEEVYLEAALSYQAAWRPDDDPIQQRRIAERVAREAPFRAVVRMAYRAGCGVLDRVGKIGVVMNDDLKRYAPPDVPLRLTVVGPGSRSEIVDYVRTVIEQRTTPNDDTSADRLARGIVTSILGRLGAGYSIASGQATVALVPVDQPLDDQS